MSADPNQIRIVIENARSALRQGDHATAFRLAEQAARLAPNAEEPWLILTAVSTDPRAALEFAKRALTINPNSERAHKAVEWAKKRLPEDVGRNGISSTTSIEPVSRSVTTPQGTYAPNPLASLPRAVATSPAPSVPAPKAESPAPKKTNRRSLAYIALLAGFACLAIAITGWSAIKSPVVASLLSADSEPAATATLEDPHSAQFDVAMPSETPTWTFTPSITPTATSTFTPLPTFTSTATLTPEFTSTPLPTDTPAPTDTPGLMEAAIVADTPTSVRPPTKAYVAPTKASSSSSSSSGGTTSYGARWIDVNLSQQMVYAYEGDVVVNSFLTSTGTWATPTVTGSYKIYVKYVSTTMAGPGYNLPNVPYTMYFYKGYGIHGTYWHNNFGTPMSHGCVNLSIPDAEWLYYWASVGTVVNVHY